MVMYIGNSLILMVLGIIMNCYGYFDNNATGVFNNTL